MHAHHQFQSVEEPGAICCGFGHNEVASLGDRLDPGADRKPRPKGRGRGLVLRRNGEEIICQSVSNNITQNSQTAQFYLNALKTVGRIQPKSDIIYLSCQDT